MEGEGGADGRTVEAGSSAVPGERGGGPAGGATEGPGHAPVPATPAAPALPAGDLAFSGRASGAPASSAGASGAPASSAHASGDRVPSRAPGSALRVRLHVTLVAGVAAAFVTAVLCAAWLIADGVAGHDGVSGPFGRLLPVVRGMTTFGVPGGALLVGAAVWAVARRWGATLVAGGVTAALLRAHALWAEHFNKRAPLDTAEAALDAGFRFAVPVTALIVAFTAWVAAEPLGRLVPWRKGAWWAPLALGAVLVAAGTVWGVARPWDRMPDHVEDNAHSLWLLLAGGTLASVLTGWVAARLTLRPVEAMRAELADITARSLDRRVPVPVLGGVLQQLARTLNATLDRLQAAADRQARFVTDASHELRSPIAGLRASLESSLTHPEGVDWPQTVRGTLADVERIQHLTDDLLLLTRIDGPAPHEDEAVQLADLAGDLVQEYRHLRRNRDLRVDCEVPAAGLPALTGSSLRLERLLRNLLDNACRHARTEVAVVLDAGQGRQTVRIEVRDDGPGIPPADRDRVFERFTRLDDSRTRADGGGAGLGLAIAREIAARQGGRLYVAAGAGPGAVLIAEFPVVRPVRTDEARQPDGSPRAPRSRAGLAAMAAVAVAVVLLAVGFADAVRDTWNQVTAPTPKVFAVPETDPRSRVPVDALHPVSTLLWGGTSVNVHLYAPARTEAEAWEQVAVIRRHWPTVLPGGAVRTPGARPPFGIGNTLFVAGLREEDGAGVLAYGALPAPGRGSTRTAAVLVPDPSGASGRTVELVLGWAPPTLGAVSYRWDDGTVKWPELQKVLGSDRRWFVTMGPAGAKSKGYDVYALKDRRTVGTG
ncbi:ATP-binding protein [Streptomyces sp. CA-294286]|uniref:sensor histidine kinase n=1 Tax=Streptomyces sp. CA-294286 TaxID=3240070 RepID=UPI003D8DA402